MECHGMECRRIHRSSTRREQRWGGGVCVCRLHDDESRTTRERRRVAPRRATRREVRGRSAATAPSQQRGNGRRAAETRERRRNRATGNDRRWSAVTLAHASAERDDSSLLLVTRMRYFPDAPSLDRTAQPREQPRHARRRRVECLAKPSPVVAAGRRSISYSSFKFAINLSRSRELV